MEIQEGQIYLNIEETQGRKVVGIFGETLSYRKYDVKNEKESTNKEEICKVSTFRKWANKPLVFPFKKLSSQELEKIKTDIKGLLHAHRDCLRGQGKDTRRVTFDVRDGYYGEAFGMMRTLKVLGYGYFGSSNLNAIEEHTQGFRPTNIPVTKINPEDNLRWWLETIQKEVLEEEGFYDQSYFCPVCEEKYKKGQY